MNDFPSFMKNPVNMIDPSSQYTPGIEGYLFDGADGSQMAFWTYKETATSKEHMHDFNEYVLVVQGQYNLYIDKNVIPLKAGDEYVVPAKSIHRGEIFAGTRAIYAFGGKRAKRVNR
jgi:quercetin dioxygenase-like cupin family protein